jgi:hypothetical protein
MSALACKIAGGVGLSGVLGSFRVLYALLTDPYRLLELYNAVVRHANPDNIVGQLAAALIGLTLSIAVAIIAALFHPSPVTAPKG